MKNGQWMCEFNNSEIWQDGEYFDTREEAIAYGKAKRLELNQEDEEDKTSFQIGQLFSYTPSVDVDRVIDDIAEQAGEECGEVGEEYLYRLPKEQEERLQELLNNALQVWLDETNNQPNFFRFYDTEIITL